MMTAKELLTARSALCRKERRKTIFLPCKGCPLEKIQEPGTSCRDSVLKHKDEAAEILETK